MNYKATQTNRDIIAHSEYSNLTDYVIAQAKHETANFTSKVYQLNNNAFGMKNGSFLIEGESKGTTSPEGNTYAKYVNDTVSFKDMLRWLRWSKMPLKVESVEQYAKELKARKYYGDTVANYTKGLKKWLVKE
jgi:uncharacterized FlgJ-related protein